MENSTQQTEASPKSRSWETLVGELKRVADEGSTAFWTFWHEMTPEERMTVLKDEPQAGRR